MRSVIDNQVGRINARLIVESTLSERQVGLRCRANSRIAVRQLVIMIYPGLRASDPEIRSE